MKGSEEQTIQQTNTYSDIYDAKDFLDECISISRIARLAKHV